MTAKVLVIGISGVTCGGKTTLSAELNRILPKSKLISQDDYFLDTSDPRHTWIPSLNHINFELLSSLDMEKMYSDITQLIKGKTVITSDSSNKKMNFHDLRDEAENLQSFLYEKINKSSVEVLIVEGFSIFNYRPLLSLFSLKYYFTLTKEDCYKRRILRTYDPPDCPGYFTECVWPEHLKQLKEVQVNVRDVKYFDGTKSDNLQEVLLDAITLL